MTKTPLEIYTEDLQYIKDNVSTTFNLETLDIEKLTLKDIPNFTVEASLRLDTIQANYRGNGSAGITKKELNKLQFLEAADGLRDDIEDGDYLSDVIDGRQEEAKRKALQLLARAFKQ